MKYKDPDQTGIALILYTMKHTVASVAKFVFNS